jgi:butyrate kinase
MDYKILVINPGNTSTKIAIFNNEEELYQITVDHGEDELTKYQKIRDQKAFRVELVQTALYKGGFKLSDMDVIIGRGGLGKPMEGGLYRINQAMINDLEKASYGEHASNLGAMIAKDLGDKVGVASFIMDPVSIDEMEAVARLSGLKELPRKSLLHALNSRAVARWYGKEIGKRYEDLRLIVVHLGSGISVTPHIDGRIIDCNNAMSGGPMSPDRAGGLPSKALVELCYSGKYKTLDEMIKKINREGGLYDHLGTSDLREAEKMVTKGDAYADLVLKAMVYQIAKEIGAMATVLEGWVDAIIVTGGMAHSKRLIEDLEKKVSFIGPLVVRPGELEMEALAKGAYDGIRGEMPIKEY